MYDFRGVRRFYDIGRTPLPCQIFNSGPFGGRLDVLLSNNKRVGPARLPLGALTFTGHSLGMSSNKDVDVVSL